MKPAAKRIFRKQDDKGETFCEIDQTAKKGHYVIRITSSQFKYCERVELVGFTELPSGFYTKNGNGLTAAGTYLLREIFDKYNRKIALSIKAKGKFSIVIKGARVRVAIPHKNLTSINTDVRTIKGRKNAEIRAHVQRFLANAFTKEFREFKGAKLQYAPGSLAALFEQKQVMARLNRDDREKLAVFIPDYLSKIKGRLTAQDKLRVIFDSMDAGRKVYFTKIVQEFKRRLRRKAQTEAGWQEFLSEYILVLRNNYGEVLEKTSVTLQGKYPDFMLIDPYNYLDIYEIKKPTTSLLKHDASRNNYYWDVEISKAISQVENYLHQVQKNSNSLIYEIKQSKGIDVSIVRPRGYIIAGMREQLANPKMVDDLRILSEGLKNIDVIPYDDLLGNLDAFVGRMAGTKQGDKK